MQINSINRFCGAQHYSNRFDVGTKTFQRNATPVNDDEDAVIISKRQASGEFSDKHADFVSLLNKYNIVVTPKEKKEDRIKKELQNTIKNGAWDEKEYDKIFLSLGVGALRDEQDGKIILTNYSIPKDIELSDFGIDENEMFKSVKIIKGDVDFSNSEITDLKNVTTIEGNADFSHSKVKNLGKLEKIGGNAIFGLSDIESLNNLEEIGNNAYFIKSKVSDLGKLKHIYGEAWIEADGSNLKREDFKDIKCERVVACKMP